MGKLGYRKYTEEFLILMRDSYKTTSEWQADDKATHSAYYKYGLGKKYPRRKKKIEQDVFEEEVYCPPQYDDGIVDH